MEGLKGRCESLDPSVSSGRVMSGRAVGVTSVSGSDSDSNSFRRITLCNLPVAFQSCLYEIKSIRTNKPIGSTTGAWAARVECGCE